MPLYRYKALNARGEMLDGQMEAASDAEVALRLQEQGHLPVEARLAGEGGGAVAHRWLSQSRNRVRGASIAVPARDTMPRCRPDP